MMSDLVSMLFFLIQTWMGFVNLCRGKDNKMDNGLNFSLFQLSYHIDYHMNLGDIDCSFMTLHDLYISCSLTGMCVDRPVGSLWGVDVASGKLQHFFGGAHTWVRVRLHMKQLWRQTVVRGLWSRGDVYLQLSYTERDRQSVRKGLNNRTDEVKISADRYQSQV